MNNEKSNESRNQKKDRDIFRTEDVENSKEWEESLDRNDLIDNEELAKKFRRKRKIRIRKKQKIAEAFRNSDLLSPPVPNANKVAAPEHPYSTIQPSDKKNSGKNRLTDDLRIEDIDDTW